MSRIRIRARRRSRPAPVRMAKAARLAVAEPFRDRRDRQRGVVEQLGRFVATHFVAQRLKRDAVLVEPAAQRALRHVQRVCERRHRLQARQVASHHLLRTIGEARADRCGPLPLERFALAMQRVEADFVREAWRLRAIHRGEHERVLAGIEHDLAAEVTRVVRAVLRRASREVQPLGPDRFADEVGHDQAQAGQAHVDLKDLEIGLAVVAVDRHAHAVRARLNAHVEIQPHEQRKLAHALYCLHDRAADQHRVPGEPEGRDMESRTDRQADRRHTAA